MSAAREGSPGEDDQPTMPLVSAGSSDTCVVCGAHLASDQRYCVDCGNRRGAARFQLATPATASTHSSSGASGASAGLGGSGRTARMNSSMLLLATVFIVLLAVGVGVLIGHSNSPARTGKQPVKFVINEGAGAGTSDEPSGNTGSSSATGATPTSGSTGKRGHKSAAKAKSAKSTAAAASATNANASAKGKAGATAAAKSFSNTATKKSTVGGACSSGTAGCQNGKQTGNLFGG